MIVKIENITDLCEFAYVLNELMSVFPCLILIKAINQLFLKNSLRMKYKYNFKDV